MEIKLLVEDSVKSLFINGAVNLFKVYIYKLKPTACRFNNTRVRKKIIIQIFVGYLINKKVLNVLIKTTKKKIVKNKRRA